VSQRIVLVGLSHHTAPVEVRERVAFADGRLERALRGLVSLPGVNEGVIVSTCNRVEVVACGRDPDTVAAELPSFLADALKAIRAFSAPGTSAAMLVIRACMFSSAGFPCRCLLHRGPVPSPG